MNDMTATGTALTLPTPTDLAALFKDGAGIDPLIARIEAEVRAHPADTSTKKGRDAIASLAHKVARSKTALDDAGKALNENARKQINLVDAARKSIRDRLDALKVEARAPLTAWEEAEDARKAKIEAVMADLRNHGMTSESTSEQIKTKAAELRAIVIDDSFAEFQVQAEMVRDTSIEGLRSLFAVAKAREDQQAELEALRAEKAARDAAEEAARIEREQAEAARLAAERAEQERKDAEARAIREADERAARERANAERIEREKEEAVARAAAEAEARHQRELAEAARREEQAAQRERDRIAAEQRAEAEAQRKREESARIRNRVRREIATALNALPQPLTPETVAEVLVAGGIPNCKVTF